MRTTARIVAFNLIYINIFEDKVSEDPLDFFIKENSLNEKEISFVKELFNEYLKNKNEIQMIVRSLADNYELERIYKVDLALIYLGITEIKFFETPKPVVINEILEISKTYSTEKSFSFINGILSKVE